MAKETSAAASLGTNRVLEFPEGEALGTSFRWSGGPSGGQYCAIHTAAGIVGCGIYDVDVAGEFGLAVAIAPSGAWRSLYTTATVALAAVTLLRLNLLIDLSGWQKLEIFCVAAGLVMLIASHVARFREAEGTRDETVSFGLWLGSALATAPLLLAFAYHRWFGAGPSLSW